MMQREYGTMYNGLIWAKEALENTFPPFWRWENGYALVDKIVDGVTAPEYQRDMEKCIKEKLRIGFLQNAQVNVERVGSCSSTISIHLI